MTLKYLWWNIGVDSFWLLPNNLTYKTTRSDKLKRLNSNKLFKSDLF